MYLQNTMFLAATKSVKAIIVSRSNQGHKVIDLDTFKCIISHVCMPNMKSLSLTIKVKVDNRQTNRHIGPNKKRCP